MWSHGWYWYEVPYVSSSQVDLREMLGSGEYLGSGAEWSHRVLGVYAGGSGLGESGLGARRPPCLGFVLPLWPDMEMFQLPWWLYNLAAIHEPRADFRPAWGIGGDCVQVSHLLLLLPLSRARYCPSRLLLLLRLLMLHLNQLEQ